MSTRLLAIAAVASLASLANAQITITEASPTGSSGFVASDWFELTNFGPLAVDITGWKVDDNSNAFANSLALLGITSIAPGESVVFIETSPTNAAARLASFRTFWGQLSSVQVGTYNGSGIGLSGSGDAVNIFLADGTLVTRVDFGAQPNVGVSFGYNPLTNTFGANSVAGVFGARVADGSTIQTTEVGSPGVIPAPSACALLALAGIAAGRRRR